ncbi:ABC transporter ATP-binding protein [Thermococcus sp. 9N3]|uniref:ABC transporter ATP-binding protein n=1 Tax=Thermococcus sp. 9N3 TaxID=163002 RepID=UPI001431F392|nr:ABC transporter ATP-binding protein [Thermococcus sp. 9N3]NJE48257.1 ABC transporter ATP-binding protein [Thermococcus sp. 9N3]
MLRVKNLWFSYNGRRVLRGVSFDFNEGVGCLLGPNGAGKSTLMKCIAGILKGEGKVTLDGRDVLKMPERERAKLISYSPQEFSVSFPYTVFEVVLMGRNPYVNPLRGPGEEDEELAWKSLEVLGLAELAERPFTELSGGQKRLVMLARSIAQGGRLLLFDEPTSFLDFRNQHVVLSAIRELGRGRLILVSLHDPNQAMAFCDSVFLLRSGSIFVSGRPQKVLTPENLSRLYKMPVEVIEVAGRRVIVPGANKSVLLQTMLLTESVIKLDAKSLEVVECCSGESSAKL